MSNTFAIIGGGGTGGHVIPGLAVADELVARGRTRGQIRFIGSLAGMDAQLVPQRGYQLDALTGRGIRRSISPSVWIPNMKAIVGLAIGVIRGIRLVRKHRPDVVISVGGYASFAASVGAIVWRVPLILMDQNAKAGAANRAVRWFATASAVPFPETDLPRRVLTGNPVRAEILTVDRVRDRLKARADLRLAKATIVIAVASGSLGARRINDAIFGLSQMWRDRTDVEIYHVIGRRDFASTKSQQRASASGALRYHPVEFEHRMDVVYAAADILIGRAGGTTMAELAIVGLPAIVVPLPIAPRDHQTANARAMGSAVVCVNDSECNAERLATVLSEIVTTPGQLSKMSADAQLLGRRDAVQRVADLVELHARKSAAA